MAINVTQSKEDMALYATGQASWVSVHTASPGQSGANEATGGSPAYARKQTTWTGGTADGTVAGSAVTIDLPAGTYTHIGLFTASTSGTCKQWVALGSSVTLGAQGQLIVTPTMAVS